MPQRRTVDPSEFEDAPAPSGRRAVDPAELADESESGIGPGMLAGGAAALGAGALALAAKKYGVGPLLDTLNNVRRQSMLTGLALPKSLLGNIGGAAMESIERGSMGPLKEMLRLPTNVKNAVAAFKEGATYQGVPASAWALPGRLLGATDEAAQAALVRSGLSAEEAATAMLQTPLGKNRITDALSTPLGNYLVPFRRTPINQGIGALETMNDWSTPGKTAANLASIGTGAATGYGTEDKTTPALGAAAMGRRGGPFLGGALAGRLAAGASGRKAADVMQGISPVSDYSISEGIAGPLALTIPKPALWRLLFGSEK